MKKFIKIVLGLTTLIFSIIVFTNVACATVTDTSGPLVPVTEQQVSQMENGVVYIGSEGCPDCNNFKPILQNYLESKKHSVNYFCVDKYINNSDIGDLMDKLGVEYIPTIVVIQNGKVIKSWVVENNFTKTLNDISSFLASKQLSW